MRRSRLPNNRASTAAAGRRFAAQHQLVLIPIGITAAMRQRQQVRAQPAHDSPYRLIRRGCDTLPLGEFDHLPMDLGDLRRRAAGPRSPRPARPGSGGVHGLHVWNVSNLRRRRPDRRPAIAALSGVEPRPAGRPHSTAPRRTGAGRARPSAGPAQAPHPPPPRPHHQPSRAAIRSRLTAGYAKYPWRNHAASCGRTTPHTVETDSGGQVVVDGQKHPVRAASSW